MILSCLMVTAYILFCARFVTRPCKYFQLNARFFDRQVGVFSKVGIDELIPAEWQLAQFVDDGVRQPRSYPVFVKPEWSQNARGVRRADDAAALHRIRVNIDAAKCAGAATVAYLIQEAAMEKREYEIFSIRAHDDPQRYAVLTVTEVRNARESNPVNSIYNPNTRYVEITDSFSNAQLEQLWNIVQRIGDFAISRVSVRADSADDLLRGELHVIEVNLFLPMPINLLDARYSKSTVFATAIAYMRRLALATKHRPRDSESKPVFIKSMLYNRRSRLLNRLRARL
ncbi:MAG: hypothetical protein OXU62_08735 [Gammaproteobacteria bacterium]|nr:hypothetical protein [Gammaproteobacteria bacterium]